MIEVKNGKVIHVLTTVEMVFAIKTLKEKLFLLREIEVEGEKWRVLKKSTDSVELAQFNDEKKVVKTIVRKFSDLI